MFNSICLVVTIFVGVIDAIVMIENVFFVVVVHATVDTDAVCEIIAK